MRCFLPFLLSLLALCACGGAQKVVTIPPVVVQPTIVAPPEDPLLQRCRQRLEVAGTERGALLLASAHTPVDAAAVLNAYNKLSVALDNAEAESGLMRAVHPDAKVRDAASECERLVAARRTELSLDRPLYEAFAKLDRATRPADEQRLIDKTIDEFKRAGVDKD